MMIPAMKDMQRDLSDFSDMPAIAANNYPYGLCISLGDAEVEKLGLEDETPEIGDMIHLFCMAKVTSISEDGNGKRIELQITHMACEDEDEENEEEDSEE